VFAPQPQPTHAPNYGHEAQHADPHAQHHNAAYGNDAGYDDHGYEHYAGQPSPAPAPTPAPTPARPQTDAFAPLPTDSLFDRVPETRAGEPAPDEGGAAGLGAFAFLRGREKSNIAAGVQDQAQSHDPHAPAPMYGAGFGAPEPAYPPEYAAEDPYAHHAPLPAMGASQWAGALMSIALIIGLILWGYQLIVRDIRGVPVIPALEGEARMVPDDPGGQLATHQGLSVNSVTAEGEASLPAETMVLAPDPVALAGEDVAMGELEPLAATTPATAPEPTPYALTPQAETTTEADTRAADVANAPVQTPAEAGLSIVAVEPNPLQLQDVQPVSATGPVIIDDPDAGLSVSPIPKARPVDLAASIDPARLGGAAADIISAVGASDEIAVQEVPVGARLVQFSAFRSQDVARAEWDRLSTKFGELLEGKQRVLEEAQSGGQTFYRLRAYGFADAQDANRFCAAVTALREQCVPTVQQ